MCKDFYTLSTIDDLFLFSGASLKWWQEPVDLKLNGERMKQVYGWIEGINNNDSLQLNRILEGVAIQMIENEFIDDSDKIFLKSRMDLSDNPVKASSFTPAKTIKIPKKVEELLEIR